MPDHSDVSVLKSLELSESQWRDLVSYVREKSKTIEIIACIYDKKAADFAVSLGVNAFKVHTADLSNFPLLKHISQLNLRIDLSVGSSTFEEIAAALECINCSEQDRIWLMYGKQLFPTSPSDADILQAVNIQSNFNLPVGYQDHTEGGTEEANLIPLLAMGAGIKIHEKHVTHDREQKGADFQAAMDPDEFIKFVMMMRNASKSLGSPNYRSFSQAELNYRKYSKKTMVYAGNLTKGTQINEESLLFLRSEAKGLLADELGYVLNRKLIKNVKKYETVKRTNFE